MGLISQLEQTAEYLLPNLRSRPAIGIILGTGLGSLARQIKTDFSANYDEIPNFPTATAVSHKGALIFGSIENKPVMAMEGRFHYYEGYSLQQVTYPVRLMKHLGCKILIVSNASGGMNTGYKKGDIAVITDHINFMGVNPLIGPNEDTFGPRFPDMTEPYDQKLIKLAKATAKKLEINLREGVYIAVTGPNIETSAEYGFLHLAGADMVGMSTVPEVIVARHQGTKVLGLSVITDMGIPGQLEPLTIEEVVRIAAEVEPVLTRLIINVIASIDDSLLS